MNDDFIFCPLCGESSWLTDKSRTYDEARLESHKCSDCKKFTYTNIVKKAESELGLFFYHKTRHSIEAEVGEYLINTLCQDGGQTQIRYVNDWKIILTLNKVVGFNWYKSEEITLKVKKYLLFS